MDSRLSCQGRLLLIGLYPETEEKGGRITLAPDTLDRQTVDFCLVIGMLAALVLGQVTHTFQLRELIKQLLFDTLF